MDRLSANPASSIVKHQQAQNDGTVISIPLSVSVTNLLGVYYWESGEAEQAKTMFELAVSKEPKYDAALDNLEQLSAKTQTRKAQ